MRANSQRLASVVLALTLSGTPALFAACALLCAPASSDAASAPATPDHAACCIPDRDAPPGSHTHHGAHDRTATSTALGDADRSQMTGADASCCPDSQTASLAATAPGRTDGGLLVASPAVAVAVVAARPTAGNTRAGALHRPLRHPARTPLVLRI